MEDPMAREEKLITYLHTAQQAAEDRFISAFLVSHSPSRNSFGFIRRAHYNLPAVATRCMVSTNTLKTFVVTGSQVLARIPAQFSISGSGGAGIQECA